MGKVRPQHNCFVAPRCPHCGTSLSHSFCWDMAPTANQRRAVARAAARKQNDWWPHLPRKGALSRGPFGG